MTFDSKAWQDIQEVTFRALPDIRTGVPHPSDANLPEYCKRFLAKIRRVWPRARIQYENSARGCEIITLIVDEKRVSHAFTRIEIETSAFPEMFDVVKKGMVAGIEGSNA